MKILTYFILFLVSFNLFSQENELDRYYKQQSKENKFEKSKKFKGPTDWNSSYPTEILEYSESEYGTSEEYLDYESSLNDEVISQSRIEKYGQEYGTGSENKPNPDIIPPNPVELPDIDIPDIDLPDIDLPDFSFLSFGTWEFWKNFLLFVVIGALLFILFLLFKNIRPLDSRVRVNVDDEWNPTVVTKSELEQKLETAILGNNYRECVRIHFMFILKELISNDVIDWKPEKTNYDYLSETRAKLGYDAFSECVRIYDLVWYGDYEISLSHYNRLKPTLENYYQSLIKKHDK